jgi:hypothetical protein
MATTTNYGWTTPDDTALVKDGAAAIRTLGSSVDTTTKALNPSTTLGDIEYRSSTANTNTRLGIGTTGQVLLVSGGVPAWGTPTAGGKTLLSTTTLSGASTTVSSISGAYKDLFIEVYGATWDTNVDDGAFSTNLTNALSAKKMSQTAISYPVSNATTCNAINDGSDNLKNTGGNNYIAWYFNNYASTTDYKTFTINGSFEGGGSTGCVIAMFGGVASDTAINSFTFKTNNGHNLTAGTIKVYGVN